MDERRVISCVSRCLNPYGQWKDVLELARSADLEIVVSNTTEAGIVYENESRFDQEPPVSFPAKLTRVLFERYAAWRPDRAMNLEKETYLDYLARLGQASGVEIKTFADLKKALHIRLDYFAAHQCVLSDHALNYVMYAPAPEEEVEAIFAARLNGRLPDAREEAAFKYAFMSYAAGEYHDRGWVMQLHYGCRRDNNPVMFRRLGPDTGFDCVDNFAPSAQTAAFLGALESAGKLPKTILYSLNTNDNAAIDSVLGCFQSDEAVGKIQHGSAWWFNDHFDGMSEQMKSLANLGYLAGFVGMLTDSRSFLSYPRHEYFRRILCRIFGEWVEGGFYPEDMETLKEIVSDISCGNARRYFGFSPKKT